MNAALAHSSLISDLNGPLEAYEALVNAGKITPDDAQRKLAERLQQLHDQVEKANARPHSRKGLFSFLRLQEPSKAPRGLYIYGEVGRGKSMLMDLFYSTISTEKKCRVHFHAFMQDVHARIHQWRQEHQAQAGIKDPIVPVAKALAQEAWLLCFDEFQVHDVTDALILRRLFSTLFEEGVIVVITSNRHPEDLYQGGLQRDQFLKFVGYLLSQVEAVTLDSREDYRLKQLQAMEKVYYTPLGRKADVFLDDAFTRLTNDTEPDQATLDVKGRTLVIPRAHGDIAWFTFDELCKEALGSADYLTLAQEYHTLLLQDIPILSPEKRNEAKRFVTLIDILYDHKVKLICTAEAEPDELYPEGDGSFEFKRTVSRLNEMQSVAYLHAEHVVNLPKAE